LFGDCLRGSIQLIEKGQDSNRLNGRPVILLRPRTDLASDGEAGMAKCDRRGILRIRLTERGEAYVVDQARHAATRNLRQAGKRYLNGGNSSIADPVENIVLVDTGGVRWIGGCSDDAAREGKDAGRYRILNDIAVACDVTHHQKAKVARQCD